MASSSIVAAKRTIRDDETTVITLTINLGPGELPSGPPAFTLSTGSLSFIDFDLADDNSRIAYRYTYRPPSVSRDTTATISYRQNITGGSPETGSISITIQTSLEAASVDSFTVDSYDSTMFDNETQRLSVDADGVWDDDQYAWQVSHGSLDRFDDDRVTFTPPKVTRDTVVTFTASVQVQGTGRRAQANTSDSDSLTFTITVQPGPVNLVARFEPQILGHTALDIIVPDPVDLEARKEIVIGGLSQVDLSRSRRGTSHDDGEITGHAGIPQNVPGIRGESVQDTPISGHADLPIFTGGRRPEFPDAPTGEATAYNAIRWSWVHPDETGTFPVLTSMFRYRRVGDADWEVIVGGIEGTSYLATDLIRLSEYEAQVSVVSLLGPSEWSPSGLATTPDARSSGSDRDTVGDADLGAGTYAGLANDGTYVYVLENRAGNSPILRAFLIGAGGALTRAAAQDKDLTSLSGQTVEGVTILNREIFTVHYTPAAGSFRNRHLSRFRLSDAGILATRTQSTLTADDFGGMTSRNNLIYLADADSTTLRAFNNQFSTQSAAEFTIGSGDWTGLAANDLLLWAINAATRKVQVYDPSAQARITDQEFDLPTGTDEYEGITTSGETIWLLNNTANRVEGFTIDQGSLTGVAVDDGMIEGHAGPPVPGADIRVVSEDDGQIEGHAGIPTLVQPPEVRGVSEDDGQIEGRAGIPTLVKPTPVRATAQDDAVVEGHAGTPAVTGPVGVRAVSEDDGEIQGHAGLPTVEVGQVRSYAHDDGTIEGHAGIPAVTGPVPVRAVSEDDVPVEGHSGPTSLILGVFAVSQDDGQIEGHAGIPTVVQPPEVRGVTEDDGRIEARAGLPTVVEPAEVRPVSKDDARIEGHTSAIIIARPIRPISKDDGTIEGHAGPAFIARAIRPVSKDDGRILGFAGPPRPSFPRASHSPCRERRRAHIGLWGSARDRRAGRHASGLSNPWYFGPVAGRRGHSVDPRSDCGRLSNPDL